MKTHEFAEALILLGRMLKDGPNVQLQEKSLRESILKNGTGAADTALSLTSMVALSRMTKAEWRELIQVEWGLPVLIKPTDSARDLIGRLLRFLDDNPDALRKLRKESARKSRKASPELLKALEILLGEGDDEKEVSE